MKRLVVSLCALVALIVCTHSVDAQPTPAKAPAAALQKVAAGEVEDGAGRKLGRIALPANGKTEQVRHPSGIRFSVDMKNGNAVGAKAVDGSGRPLPANVVNNAARRIIVIVIITDDTVIVVVIRQR